MFTLKDIMSLRIVNFPEKIIQEFEENITPYFHLISNLSDQNVNLAITRDIILPNLISEDLSLDSIKISKEFSSSQNEVTV